MWVIFSQISALSETISNLLAKKSLGEYDSNVLTWFWVATSQAFLFIILLISGIPTILPAFYFVISARLILDTMALLLFTKALQLEDVSLITPLFNFSAVFSLFFSLILNNELPSIWGITGVFVIVFGAYLLNYEKDNSNYLHPLVSIFKKKASSMMILSTVLYGIIFSISKIGIQTSSLIFYTYISALGLSLTILPIAYKSNKNDLIKILKPKNAIRVLPLGLIDSIKILALMATINTSYVTFADASNNTSVLYNQVFAKLFLKEKIRSRLFPSLLMFVGLLMIITLN